jgi:hypothetical protein
MTFEIEFSRANKSTLTGLHGSMKKEYIFLISCANCSVGAQIAQLVRKSLSWCANRSVGAQIAQLVRKLLSWCANCSVGAQIAQLVHSY